MVKNIDVKSKPTPEQIQMLENAKKIVISKDDEYPEFTKEELSKFKKISEEKKIDRQKQVVTLRLSGKALKKAKSLGKGYTSILSRIIEGALEDPEIIKQYI